jgi:teichuronic acid exporter
MSIKITAARGVLWTGVAQMSSQGLTLGITVVMARLLSPEAFGVVAMATIVIWLGYILQEVGLGAAVVQQAELDHDDLSTVFWTNVIAGLFLASFVYLCAPLIAGFYRQPAVKPVLQVLSIWFLVGALIPAQVALLTRELDFKTLALRQMGGVLAGGLVGVWMAVAGFGVWSLVAQALVSQLGGAVLMWALSPWRPKRVFDIGRFRKLSRYGVRFTGAALLKFWGRSADRLLVGKCLGSGPLGYYQVASSWMLVPQVLVYEVIGRVAFPALSRVQDDLEAVRKGFVFGAGLIGVVVVPVMGVVIVAAPELVHVIYGSKWLAAVLPMQFLALIGIRQTVLIMNGPVFQGLGRVDLQLKWEALSLGAMVTATLVGSHYGLSAVAGLNAAAAMLTTPFLLRSLLRVMEMPFTQWAVSLVPTVKVTAFTVLFAAIMRSYGVWAQWSPACVLIASVVTAMLAYVVIAKVVARAEIAEFIRTLRTALNRGSEANGDQVQSERI